MLLSDLKIALSQVLADAGVEGMPRASSLNLLDHFPAGANREQVIGLSISHLIADVYGKGETTLRQECLRLIRLVDLFLERYGDGPVTLLRAPARINMLGEHIDYVTYIPTASLTFGSRQRDMLMLYRRTDMSSVRCASTSHDYPPSSFKLLKDHSASSTENIETEWLSFLHQTGTPAPHWQNYATGAAYFANNKFGMRILNGFDFVVDSTIPPGGGASSSSALVVLAGAAIREVNNVSFTLEELAKDSAMAEWYIGTRGGSMDHTTICLAKPSSAVLIGYSPACTRPVALPASPFQWITFFSKPADKGREIMIEYNERAAVSRLVIPAIISSWQQTDPTRHRRWCDAIESLKAGSVDAVRSVELLLTDLPDKISLERLEEHYPKTFRELEKAFPALVSDRRRWPMTVRKRALHHLGEIKRVALAARKLDADTGNAESQMSTMREIGVLLNESHASLRDLYDVSTEEVERLISVIKSDTNVFGARLMGGGFGGNVLALTTEEHAAALIDRTQIDYYEPQQRDGIREGSIMISTPGAGLAHLSLSSTWRRDIERVNSAGYSTSQRNGLCSFIDALPVQTNPHDVWPVIVAAGKGSRAAATGLQVPKPVAEVSGKPAIVRVLNSIRDGIGKTRPPVVIVSPETGNQIRSALEHEDVSIVLQPEALGTGDAVLHASELIRDFDGLTLVVWSTQPVIRAKTFERAVKLARLFCNYQMVVPTTYRALPYAPLRRDESGQVQSSVETHLESADVTDFGETNIGLFVLKHQTMFEVLDELRERYWNDATNQYNRPRGELGFPNELITELAHRENGVFACPIADAREEQGIKQLADVSRCEQFISELATEDC